MTLLGSPDKALTTGRMARGCDLCFAGLKAVIFITGECDENCYYCPVDRERFGRTVIYVNDESAYTVYDIVDEIERQGAKGASITGGDPLADLPLTLKVIRTLKEVFGPQFHIHLYTPGRHATPEALIALWRAGLDEIRFHPVKREYIRGLELARKLTGMSVGAEIPIGPGLVEWAKWVIKEVDRLGGDFVNLDELEFAEPNEGALRLRGLRPSSDRGAAARGALEAALDVLRWAETNVRVPVHFCPAMFKDMVQVRNRLRNTTARDTAWFEMPLPDGSIALGEIVDHDGNVIGHFNPAGPLPEPERDKRYRVKIVLPTQSRKPVLCYSEADSPSEALTGCDLI